MKRQIDLENDTSVVSTVGAANAAQGLSGTEKPEKVAGGQNRRFEETGKRKSEHNVVAETKWVEDEIKVPVPIARNQLYAAS